MTGVRAALRFLSLLRESPSTRPLSPAELVDLGQSQGCEFCWADFQRAFQIDWKMRAFRHSASVPKPELVQAYFDEMTPLLLEQFGCTYQAGLAVVNGTTDLPASHRFFAERAGVRSGMRILDAGCGLAGPALEIAQTYPDVTIDAVTLSPVQAKAAKQQVDECGLSERVRVQRADYHKLPYADASFDLVLFLESMGYSPASPLLFREVYRVLKPAGTIYLKEPLLRHPPVNARQSAEVRAVFEKYRYKMHTGDEVCAQLQAAGFTQVTYCDLSGQVSTRDFFESAMFASPGAATEFGAAHWIDFQELPVAYADIKARKESAP